MHLDSGSKQQFVSLRFVFLPSCLIWLVQEIIDRFPGLVSWEPGKAYSLRPIFLAR